MHYINNSVKVLIRSCMITVMGPGIQNMRILNYCTMYTWRCLSYLSLFCPWWPDSPHIRSLNLYRGGNGRTWEYESKYSSSSNIFVSCHFSQQQQQLFQLLIFTICHFSLTDIIYYLCNIVMHMHNTFTILYIMFC